MKILVMRPACAGEQLVKKLCAAGLSAWHFPLIHFSPGRDLEKLPVLLSQLTAGDLLFALSRQAVDYAKDALCQWRCALPDQLLAFAPGRATAQALHQITGLKVDYPAGREASEMLLQLAPLQQAGGKQALILRGNGGRELLAKTLSARAVSVVFCECYQRHNICYAGEQQMSRWQQLAIDTLVVTSGEMLLQLFTLTPASHRCWLLACSLVVVSERLAKTARQHGWRDIVIADNADNNALLRTLQLLSFRKSS